MAIILWIAWCSLTKPYVNNILPAGVQGILFEKCMMRFNLMSSKVPLNKVTPVKFGYAIIQRENGSSKKGKSK